MYKTIVLAACFFYLIALFGCAGSAEAPVSDRELNSKESQTTSSNTQQANKTNNKGQYQPAPAPGNTMHSVKRGDTLYSIAWRYGHDFKDIADWNDIKAPFTIFPEQKIRLSGPVDSKLVKSENISLQPGPIISDDYQRPKQELQQKTPLQPKPVTQDITPKAVSKEQISIEPAKQVQVKKQTATQKKKIISTGPIRWQWPTKGKLVKLNQPISRKGIDISGHIGQEIKTSAHGDVVYSGSGLLGYGRLIIVKHNETYLSAYAHNSELLVQEGDKVTVGQTIAKMGKTSSGQPLLHFEIRKNGKSVNPISLLPKR